MVEPPFLALQIDRLHQFQLGGRAGAASNSTVSVAAWTANDFMGTLLGVGFTAGVV